MIGSFVLPAAASTFTDILGTDTTLIVWRGHHPIPNCTLISGLYPATTRNKTPNQIQICDRKHIVVVLHIACFDVLRWRAFGR